MPTICKKCGSKGHSSGYCRESAGLRAGFNRDLFNEWLDINTETGTIRWKKTDYGITEGFDAGYATRHGDIKIRLCGKDYAAHHIVWFMETGETPARVYHRNRDQRDNAFLNLTRVRQEILNVPRPRAEPEDPEDNMRREMAERAKRIVPRRDPMIWSMFGAA